MCFCWLRAKCVSKKPSPLPLLPPTNISGHFTKVPLPSFPTHTCNPCRQLTFWGGRVRPRASHASGPGANKNRFFLASSLRPEGMPPPFLQGRNLKASVVVGEGGGVYICMNACVCMLCLCVCIYCVLVCARVDTCVCVSYVCLVIFTQMTECAENQRSHSGGFRQQLQRSLSLTHTISVPHFPRQWSARLSLAAAHCFP